MVSLIHSAIRSPLAHASSASDIASRLGTPPKGRVSFNSFEAKFSEAFSTLSDAPRSGSRAASSPAPQQIQTRQDIAATRRSSVAADATVQNGTRGTTLRPAISRAVTALPPNKTTLTTRPTATAEMSPLTDPAPADSPPDIVTTLLQQNALPSPYGQSQAPSADPGVYMGSNYIKQSNLNLILRQADQENVSRYNAYKDELQNWAAGGMRTQPPPTPKYMAVDLNGFNAWWDQMMANIGSDAPPVTFVSNMVHDNGYGGAVIASWANT